MPNLYFIKIRKPANLLPLAARFSLLFFLLLQVQFTFGQWKSQQKAHKRRAEMMNVLYKNKMYTFTGFGNWPTVEPATEVYDPDQNQWKMLAPMPAAKAVTHQGIVVVDDKVWHIGGRLQSTSGPLTNEVWIYDITRNKWRQGPALKHPVTGKPVLWGGGGAALLGRTIHVVGGFLINTCNNDQDQYHLTLDVDKWLKNPQSVTWEGKLAPLPIKRNHISTIVMDGKMYVLGGQFGHDCGGGQDQKYSHVYNPLTDTWTRLTDLPMVRSHCEASIFAANGKIFIAGGDGGTKLITRFNPETNGGRGSWTLLPNFDLPHDLIGLTAKIVRDKLIISGGKLSGSNNTRPETYARPFSREYSYKLGFVEDCFSQSVVSSEKIIVKNLLYATEGEKQYQLSSSAKWFKISKNGSGSTSPTGAYVEATIQAAGLAAGTYQAIVTAKGTGRGKTYQKASFCVKLKITKGSSVVTIAKVGSGTVTKDPDKAYYTNGQTITLQAKPARGFQFIGWSGDASGRTNPLKITIKSNRYITATFRRITPTIVRINAGGPTQKINGVTWQGCGSFSNCKDYVTGGFAYTQKPAPTITGARYNNLNQAIYQTEWTGGEAGSGSVPRGRTAFRYRIPVQNGKYLVRLYFAELNKDKADMREFDIRLEGKIIQKNFDIYAAANGKHKAIVREYPVTISDGVVTLDFIRQIQNAKVSAIEVIPFKDATLNQKPIPSAGKTQTVTANANGVAQVKLNATGSYDKDGYLVLYHWLKDNKHLTNGATPTVRLRTGTHELKLVIKDNAGAYRTDRVTVIVKAASLPVPTDTIPSIAVTPEVVREKVVEPAPAEVAMEKKAFGLKVYPNPGVSGASTFVQIENGAQQEEITVMVYDMAGQLIQTHILKTDAFGTAYTEWQLTGKLSAGTYLVRAYGKSGAAQTKLIFR